MWIAILSLTLFLRSSPPVDRFGFLDKGNRSLLDPKLQLIIEEIVKRSTVEVLC